MRLFLKAIVYIKSVVTKMTKVNVVLKISIESNSLIFLFFAGWFETSPGWKFDFL